MAIDPDARKALKLAKEATNGWACYSRTDRERDEIARLHREIAKLESTERTIAASSLESLRDEMRRLEGHEGEHPLYRLATQEWADKLDTLLAHKGDQP